MVSKKGWLRVVEAFLSALLIIVILVLVSVNQQNSKQSGDSAQFYNLEVSAIRGIELNSTLRSEVIAVPDASLPINSETDPATLSEIISAINSKIPSSLSCEVQICKPDSICDYWKDTAVSIYSQQVLVTANLTNYDPKKLKIFCWKT